MSEGKGVIDLVPGVPSVVGSLENLAGAGLQTISNVIICVEDALEEDTGKLSSKAQEQLSLIKTGANSVLSDSNADTA